jgi:hypothetical protein
MMMDSSRRTGTTSLAYSRPKNDSPKHTFKCTQNSK